MKLFLQIALLSFLSTSVEAVPLSSRSFPSTSPGQLQGITPAHTAMLNNSQLCFIENKGQITDQYGKPRKDIDYKIAVKGMNIFIGNGQIRYQLSHHSSLNAPGNRMKSIIGKGTFDTSSIEMCRLDVNLSGASRNSKVVKEEVQEYTETYYLPQCPDGVTAHTYQKITYKDVYPNIDWILYVRDNQFEYDFVVKEGGKVDDIRMVYGGATNISINQKKGLVATTRLGTIIEPNPRSYELESQQVINSGFKLKGRIVSFNVATYNGTLVIDPNPSLDWATYFGGSNNDKAEDVAGDDRGNVYITGITMSPDNIVTSGGYDTVYHGGAGSFAGDGFLTKFDLNGNRQWATYFNVGGGRTEANAVSCDLLGNVYITGTGSSVFLAKFSSLGLWKWTAHFGGMLDLGAAVACDAYDGVYINGLTQSPNIATVGSHQVSYGGGSWDTYLAKFDSLGALKWATYYGGNGYDVPLGLKCDPLGNVYTGGLTQSTNNISTVGSHKPLFTGGNNSFLAKFSSSGQLLWGTYYGTFLDPNPNAAYGGSIATDKKGHVYLCGELDSGNIMTGTFQPAASSKMNAYLAQFDTAGRLQWDTYYGGNNTAAYGVACDTFSNVYFTGVASVSSTNIATAASYQNTYGNIYVAKFDQFGRRQWGTYYGHNVSDVGTGVACLGSEVYLTGMVNDPANIATPGSFQSTYAGGGDAFLAKFHSSTRVMITDPFTDSILCIGKSFPLVYEVTESFQPGNVFTAQLSDSTGSFTNAVIIGNIVAIDSGTIVCTVPASTLPGSGYKIRLISSNIGDTSVSENVSIVSPSVPTVTISANKPVYADTFYAHVTGCATPLFQWYINGNPLAGAIDSVLIHLSSFDSVSVVMHCQDGCVDPDSAKYTLIQPNSVTGINRALHDVVVYPNPAFNSLIIGHAKGAEARLYNVVGQMLLMQVVKNSREYINIAQLPSGTFVLELLGDNGQRWSQVIIKE